MATNSVYHQIPSSALPCHEKVSTPKPSRKTLLRLEVRDLSSQAARSFLSLVECGSLLEDAVEGVLSLLYTKHSVLPTTRSVTLILRSFSGVAYTTGIDLDEDHKEIHLSTDYISHVPMERRREEILGVIRHEMVHCWQWHGHGTSPSGLTEGIADYVRLRSNMAPPHWKRAWKECRWDDGYATTGYFLDYLERRFGCGTVIRINERLRDLKYDEGKFWHHCCGLDIKTLWEQYGESCEKLFGLPGK